jgi:hypothetical protein
VAEPLTESLTDTELTDEAGGYEGTGRGTP